MTVYRLFATRQHRQLAIAKPRFPRWLIRRGLWIIFAILPACIFGSRKDRNENNREAAEVVVDRNSFTLNRTEGKTSLVIQFRTVKPAFCRIEYYAQDANKDPKPTNPVVINCQGPDAKAAFSETATNLNPDTLYFFRVVAWSKESTPEQAEIVILREGSPDIVDSPIDAAGRLRELMVTRLDAPLMTAEVHRHALDRPKKPEEVRAALVRDLGCRTGSFDRPFPFISAQKEPRITNIATRGFASAQSTPHPRYPERFKLIFNTLQYGDRWEWVFDLRGLSSNLLTGTGVQLTSVDLQSAATATLSPVQMKEPATVTPIDPSKALVLRWQLANPTDSAQFTVQIGRAGGESIGCVFNASLGQGSIEAATLSKLPSGTSMIVATVESSELQTANTAAPWLIAVYDWRFGKLQRL